METIQVAAAVIQKEGRIFATQRGYGKWKGWWEFPGGKIEPGEAPEEALKREIKEELNTIVQVEGLAEVIQYDYPDFHLTMYCYFCQVVSGKLELLEHESARWLAKGELDTVNWLPADVAFIHKLKNG